MFDVVSRRFKPVRATLAAAALAVSLFWLGVGEASAQGKTITAVMQADVKIFDPIEGSGRRRFSHKFELVSVPPKSSGMSRLKVAPSVAKTASSRPGCHSWSGSALHRIG